MLSHDVDYAFWPDGTYCTTAEIEYYSHMSDDYTVATIPSWADVEVVAELFRRTGYIVVE